MIERIKVLDEKDFKLVYQALVQSIDPNEEQLLMNFFGVISDDLIHSMGQAMEELLISYSIPKKQIKKIFSIIVEGLKNILLYGEQSAQNEKIGFIIVLKTPTTFNVLVGNPILEKVQPILEDYLQSIGNLNVEQLNAKYSETLSNSFVKDVRESGIGLLVMALKSDAGIKYHFNKLENQRILFTTEVSVRKTE
ncbi:MAG: SiaB family protein kinase [Crocinitomicaceae bacterium]|nr:SiaB family protein kinase [Crocinitomicaceae bacterium]